MSRSPAAEPGRQSASPVFVLCMSGPLGWEGYACDAGLDGRERGGFEM